VHWVKVFDPAPRFQYSDHATDWTVRGWHSGRGKSFDMYMSKAAFISNDLGNLASFTALYVTSQRDHCPLMNVLKI
jgi:hypothetical protein